jgi:protein-S-isoprenylcysteine O-methyltransferase Ste14
VTSVSSCYFILLQLNGGKVLLPYSVGQWVQIVGISLQLMAKITLGKSFGLLPANRGVVTRGPYNLVRHPMYLGYFINHMGFLACTFSSYNLLLYIGLYTMVFFRLVEEERLLLYDPSYQAYIARVRWRFLPGIF